MADKVTYFETLSDVCSFIKDIPNPVANPSSEKVDYSKWSGTKDMAESLKYAEFGWMEGAAELEKYTSLMFQELTSRLMMDDYYYDVTGQDFDLDRVLIGEPECWIQTEQVEVKAPAKHTLKMLISVEAMGRAKFDEIKTRGVAICCLIMMLEKQRRGVEIELASCAVHGSGRLETRTTLKKAGQDIDLGKLAFALCNSGFLRRMMFGVEERTGNKWQVSSMSKGQYGSSGEVDQQDADIYIGSNFGNFYQAESVEEWILAELQKQGIELKEKV